MTFNQLEFSIVGGDKAAIISGSQDKTFDPAKPHIMLLAGLIPGTYKIETRKKGNSTLLGSAKFKIETRWKNERFGPPVWISGIVPHHASGTKGWGDPNNIGIQSYGDAVPQLGLKKYYYFL